ncbi:hypothetical protein TNCV_2033891 [Trichonephila clavipes]|nr:hypothetical protein TNCV_2033891 [Trichonephila clavipes]
MSGVEISVPHTCVIQRILLFSRYLDACRMEWRSLEKKDSRRGCSLGLELSLRMLKLRGSNPRSRNLSFQALLRGSFIFLDTWTLAEWNGDL